MGPDAIDGEGNMQSVAVSISSQAFDHQIALGDISDNPA